MKEPLPEDGIVDFVAIELYVRGIRDVRLTPYEKQIAEAIRKYLLADGPDVAL